MQVTVTGSPPSASDLVAIVGIVAGVVGTLLGVFGTLWAQRRAVEHEDRTRFHQQRLVVYAQFNDACNKYIAGVSTGVPIVQAGATLVPAVTQAFETLRLVASLPVYDAAHKVHLIITNLNNGTLPNNPATMVQFNLVVASLVKFMRKEIHPPEDQKPTAVLSPSTGKV
jgi:hypothetical protein